MSTWSCSLVYVRSAKYSIIFVEVATGHASSNFCPSIVTFVNLEEKNVHSVHHGEEVPVALLGGGQGSHQVNMDVREPLLRHRDQLDGGSGWQSLTQAVMSLAIAGRKTL